MAKELQTFDAIYSQELSTGQQNMKSSKNFDEKSVDRKFCKNSKNKSKKIDVELTRGIGTPTYASPEQLRSKQYDYKTDIYSLGISF